jgi:hypothetical protein
MASPVPFRQTRPFQPTEKPLPHDLEAERAVLGVILTDKKWPEQLNKASEELSPSDFFHDHHRRIFSAMLRLEEKESPSDPVTVGAELHRKGELEAAGGAAYIASLLEYGAAYCSHLLHYAKIVRKAAALRNLIHTAHAIQQRALEGGEEAETLISEAQTNIGKIAASRADANPAVVIDFRDLLTLAMPPANFVIEPLLTVGGTGMIYAPSGAGKSYITTELAVDLAMGLKTFFKWPISRRFRVLYIYGEMNGAEIQKRSEEIAKGHRMDSPEPGYLGMMCKDFQRLESAPRAARAWRPKISSATDRRIIEERLFGGGYEVMILDNLSTLWPISQEGESDMAAVVQDWCTDLNQRGIVVVFLHHSGKSGDQLGASSKEHILDFKVVFKRPGNYEQEEQLRVVVEIGKLRHECKNPAWLAPFEISLQTNDFGAMWLSRPMRNQLLKMAFERFAAGMKPQEVWLDLGLSSRYVAIRYFNKFKENNNPEAWAVKE